MKNNLFISFVLCIILCVMPATAYTSLSASFEAQTDPAVQHAFQLIAHFKKRTARLRKKTGPTLNPEIIRLRNIYLKPMIHNVLAASQVTSAAQHIADCKELKRSIKAYITEFERVGPILDEQVIAEETAPELVFHEFAAETVEPLAAPEKTDEFIPEELPEPTPQDAPETVALPEPTLEDLEHIDSEPFRDTEIDGEFDVENEMEKVEALPLGTASKAPAFTTPETPKRAVKERAAITAPVTKEPAAKKQTETVTPPVKKTRSAPTSVQPASQKKEVTLPERLKKKAPAPEVKPANTPPVVTPAEPAPDDDADTDDLEDLDDDDEDPLAPLPDLPTPDSLELP